MGETMRILKEKEMEPERHYIFTGKPCKADWSC